MDNVWRLKEPGRTRGIADPEIAGRYLTASQRQESNGGAPECGSSQLRGQRKVSADLTASHGAARQGIAQHRMDSGTSHAGSLLFFSRRPKETRLYTLDPQEREK